LARSPALASAKITPKICQGQLQTIYSECPKFHPNLFTSGGVIAGRMKIVETHHKVFPTLDEATASSSSNKTLFICLIWPRHGWSLFVKEGHCRMNMLSFIIILNCLYRHGLASITFDSDDVHLPLLTKTTAQVSTFLCVQRWLTRPILPPPSPANRFKALLPGPPG